MAKGVFLCLKRKEDMENSVGELHFPLEKYRMMKMHNQMFSEIRRKRRILS
jgi:hypothetical protein